MTEKAIRETVFKILQTIAPEANPAETPANANLREALDIDSFDYLNLMIGLHRELNVEIPESDYGKLTTLSEIISYLSSRTKAS